MKTLSRSYIGALASALALLILAGCATTDIPESPDDYPERIAELQQRLSVNPKNPEALRDLGIIYFQSSRYYLADSLLSESLKHESRDAKTRFYLGMAQESRGDTAEALETYIHYEDYSALTPYRNLMQGRYHALSQAVISNQFQTLLAQEQELTQNDITENSIAVFPLQYNAQNPQYASLGPALSEMMIIDLGQVGRLRPLERIRIRALLKELEFVESPMVDVSSAPRMGKLLSSNHIVSGSYGVSGEENFRMDVADYDALKAEQSATISESDELANIFKAQKQVVFSLVNELGIELTPLERERIERVPTNNVQAFILYSIGLEREDALDYRAALVYYNQASEIDGGFALARTKGALMEAMIAAGGTREAALAEARRVDPPIRPDGEEERDDDEAIVLRRLENSANATGASFFPGGESRVPIDDVIRSGGGVRSLPDPPPPPGQ